MSSYKAWIAAKRAEALDLGGKPLRNLPDGRLERFRWAGTQANRVNRGFALPRGISRKPGEIVNPLSGQRTADCLTIHRLAKAVRLSPHKLTDLLVRLGLVHRVLACKDVPMVKVPEFVKPQYYHTPELTRYAVKANLAIPIKMVRNGVVKEVILVTRRGQLLVENAIKKSARAPVRNVDRRRASIAHLLRQGHSQAEISRRTSLPKQTVSRHVRSLRDAA
ncbi:MULTISPECIES: winged helix-turn-helix domain-containing protein [unclassified Mesorhizobium]|uniref:winged helix-turn-helix domain-containing protein n=1 Tax=unclassified Mesorhizobium TaxID=325217 RepID=UPI0033387327